MQEIIFKRHFERRIKPRHKAVQLNVRATLLGIFGRPKKSSLVECVDFNRYGMAISCSQKLREGDRLEFDFRGQYISESGIEGVVTSCRPDYDSDRTGACRYGIIFRYCLSPKDYNRHTDNALSRIEGLFYQHSPECRKKAS